MTQDNSPELHPLNPDEQGMIKNFAQNLQNRRTLLLERLKEIIGAPKLPPSSLVASRNDFPIHYALQPEEIEKNTIVPTHIEELKFVVDPANLTQAIYQESTTDRSVYRSLIYLESDDTVVIQVIFYTPKDSRKLKIRPSRLYRSTLRLSPNSQFSLERVGKGNPRGGKIIEYFNINYDPASDTFSHYEGSTQGKGRLLTQTLADEMMEAYKFLQI